ncbi:hypothetical protein BROUX41_000175 [Berkeleyomyces rouxiae]|uniref:uncharacterized protein n=1 Tax=Berkeleyomyces rouxiae TaxID=2035830 RepID=UPI003B784498
MSQPVLDVLADALQNLNMLTEQLQSIANGRLDGSAPDTTPGLGLDGLSADVDADSQPNSETPTATEAEINTASRSPNAPVLRSPYAPCTLSETRQTCTLALLPTELLLHVLEYLAPAELIMLARTSQTFNRLTKSDLVWQPRIQENVPHTRVASLPPGFTSFFELWRALRDQWFVARHKIWFCDVEVTGKLIVARYDTRRGCIEANQVVAVNRARDQDAISGFENVEIHPFDPRVSLHMDNSIITLRASDSRHPNRDVSRFEPEITMSRSGSIEALASSFVASRPAQKKQKNHPHSPYGTLWPPASIPTPLEQSTLGVAASMYPASTSTTADTSCIPRTHVEASSHTFHLRSWLQMSHSIHAWGIPSAIGPGYHSSMNVGAMMGETLATYATLAPDLYVPTPTRPFRGLWVGDYRGHGCEFVLIVQPDLPDATDSELRLTRQGGEDDETWQKRRLDARVYRGPLMAVKLTGDVNIPRGKFTFTVSDLGPRGYVGPSPEPRFKNARVVRSRGQIAQPSYISPSFERGELILLSQNELAHHWVDFKHICFFKRFNVDELLKQ